MTLGRKLFRKPQNQKTSGAQQIQEFTIRKNCHNLQNQAK